MSPSQVTGSRETGNTTEQAVENVGWLLAKRQSVREAEPRCRKRKGGAACARIERADSGKWSGVSELFAIVGSRRCGNSRVKEVCPCSC